MNIRFEGLDKLNAKLRSALTRYPIEAQKLLSYEAEVVKARTKLLTPVDTGQLRNSWQSTDPTPSEVTIYNNVEYAPYVEFPCRQFVYGRWNGKIRPGVYMLRDAIDDCNTRFNADLHTLMSRVFK